MGTITEEKKKRGTVYRAEVRREGERHTKRFERKTDAKAWIGDMEKQIRDGEVVRKFKKHIVAEAIDKYVAEVLPNKKPGTKRFQEVQLTWFKEKLGHLKLHKVTSAILSETREELRAEIIKDETRGHGQHRSPSTINRYFQVFKHCLGVACHEWEWLPEVPRFKQLKENDARTVFYTPAEIRTVLAKIEERAVNHLQKERRADRVFSEHMNLLIARTALFTGARLSEVCSLKWSHVDLTEGPIRLAAENTKTAKSRCIPICASLKADLTLWLDRLAERNKQGEFLFPALRPSKYGHRRDFASKVFRETAKECGIIGKTFHDIRHSAATWATTQRIPSRTVQSLLGHSKIATTERYAHVEMDAQRQAVKGIEELLNEDRKYDA